MRTTVTLDPDTEALIAELMRRDGLTFKAAVNQAIRVGLTRRAGVPFRQRTFRMGFNPAIPYDKALRLAGELEDQEIMRELAHGK
jgi:hypothetical protein